MITITLYDGSPLTPKTMYAASNVSQIQTYIKLYEKDDISGEILPNARQNPELAGMVIAIYKHKKDLYFRNLAAASNPIEFRKKMKDELGLDFPL